MNYIFSKRKPEIEDRGFVVGNRFFPLLSSNKTWNDDFLNSYDSNLFILSNIETNIYGQFTEIPEQNRQEDGVWSDYSTKYTNNSYMSLKLSDEIKDFKSILFSYWWKKTQSSQYNQYALGSDTCDGDSPHNCLHSDELNSGYNHGWRTWVVADGGCRQISTARYNEWNNYVIYYNRPSGKLYVSVNNSAFQIGTCTSADIPCCSSSGKSCLTLYLHQNTRFGGFVMWHGLELGEEEFRTFSEKLANPEIKPFNKKKKLPVKNPLVFYAPLHDNLQTTTGQTCTYQSSTPVFETIDGIKALKANGSNYFIYGDWQELLGHRSMTTSFLLRAKRQGNYDKVFSYGQWDSKKLRTVCFNNNNLLVMEGGDSFGSGGIKTTDDNEEPVWIHVVAVYDCDTEGKTTYRMYCNTVLEYNEIKNYNLQTSVSNTNRGLVLFARSDISSQESKLQGHLCELKIWNKVLNENEINQEYKRLSSMLV